VKYTKSILFAVFGLLLLILFWEPLFKSNTTLYSADQAPLYKEGFGAWKLDAMSGGWWQDGLGYPIRYNFYPLDLLAGIMPAYQWHHWTYIISTLLFGLAIWGFLRSRGLPAYAAGMAATGVAFSGYSFTLISAGHRMAFYLYPCVAGLFLFIDLALRKKRLVYYALAGGCAGLAFSSGSPDKAILFMILAAAYALFVWFGERQGAAWGSYVAKTAIGVVVALLFFGSFAAGTFGFLFNKEGGAVAYKKNLMGQTEESKWDYCTSWSLPPEDMLEFIAPCVRGIETTDPKGPYWGRLGQDNNWQTAVDQLKSILGQPGLPEAQRQQFSQQLNRTLGSLNYRQHTVYLGVIPVVFGLFGLWLAFLPKTRREELRLPSFFKGQVLFWSIALLVCLILSLGRFTPFYRLFYAFPVVDQIRCPVKFVHLVEVCLAVLFALGLTGLIGMLRVRSAPKATPVAEALSSVKSKGKKGKRKKKSNAASRKKTTTAAARESKPGDIGLIVFGALSALVALILLVSAAAVSGDGGFMREYWNSLGRGSYANVFAKNMSGGLMHGGLLFAVASAAFFALRWVRAAWLKPVILFGLLAVMALDLLIVDKKYIRTRDMSDFRMDNPVADYLAENKQRGRTSFQFDPQTTPRSYRHPVFGSFMYHNADLLEERNDRRENEQIQKVRQVLANNPTRFWQITNAHWIMGPRTRLASFLQRPGFEVDRAFEIGGDKISESEPATGTNILLKNPEALPKAIVYHNWEGLDPEAALKRLADPTWNPATSVLVDASLGSPNGTVATSPVEVSSYSRKQIDLKTGLGEPGILLLNDQFHENWVATVNGEPAEVFRANVLMRGVKLPAGKHEIRFRYKKPAIEFWGFWIATLSFFFLLFLGLATLFRRQEPTTAPNPGDQTESQVPA